MESHWRGSFDDSGNFKSDESHSVKRWSDAQPLDLTRQDQHSIVVGVGEVDATQPLNKRSVLVVRFAMVRYIVET